MNIPGQANCRNAVLKGGGRKILNFEGAGVSLVKRRKKRSRSGRGGSGGRRESGGKVRPLVKNAGHHRQNQKKNNKKTQKTTHP